MKGRLVARGGTKIATALTMGAALGLFCLPQASVAHADDVKPEPAKPQPAKPEPSPTPSPAPSASSAQCVLKGSYPVPKGTQVYDAPSDGHVVANFTGAIAALQLSELPADPTNGRARLSTSSGTGAFRIDGYVAPPSITVFTARDISVYAGHVWISSAQKVKLVQASSSSLTGELSVLGSDSQKVRASAPCDAFTLQPGKPTAMEVPGNGRGYLMKNQSLDFYDAPNGNAVFSLKMAEGGSQLFWSNERKAGYVHVMSRGDLTIDAWVKAKDLDPLKKGEMMDQLMPPVRQVNGAQLALDKPPRLVQATKEIPIRSKRDDKEKPIGAVEIGAQIYVLETVAGWTNVLPKDLSVTPPDDGGFWIPASEVPK